MNTRIVPLPGFNNKLSALRIEIDNEASITQGVGFSTYEVGDNLTVVVEIDGDVVQNELGWEHVTDGAIETIVTAAVVASWSADGWRLAAAINNQRDKSVRKETRRLTFVFSR